MINRNDRKYQIAHGVRIPDNPDNMDRDTLIDTIEDLADYASSLQTQIRTLRAVIHTAVKKGLNNE